jgi:hypothetical protein
MRPQQQFSSCCPVHQHPSIPSTTTKTSTPAKSKKIAIKTRRRKKRQTPKITHQHNNNFARSAAQRRRKTSPANVLKNLDILSVLYLLCHSFSPLEKMFFFKQLKKQEIIPNKKSPNNLKLPASAKN